ncbi:AraC family transcriptional regulator [Neobacillus niacini]|uniref:response regulator transcription factor n=1 Tax=Neobacillus niacini TaxID=86668 RepID=UPI0021CB6052|nr:AraC family transcriptional regulator [Neobacillus niacini]MCM3766293.1 AraC family transcriptional regulator [Neobacillus niacini]
MYKVMLVDDDYPVLQLLSEVIEWDQLGVTLKSMHENGASAFEKALADMPDILITDIGMPKMNGIELTQKLKELNPNLQVAILSCHADFEYAHQALRLQVQDYLIKDTFVPEELSDLIRKFKKNLDEKNNKASKVIELKQMFNQNKESIKERFIRKTIDSSDLNEKEWLIEAKTFGLDFGKTGYMGAIAMIHHFQVIKEKFKSEDALTFAINNVVSEKVGRFRQDSVHFQLGAREFFVFIPSSLKLKKSSVSDVRECLRRIQQSIKSTLNISLSFVIGEGCSTMIEFKRELVLLKNSKHQSFYLEPGEIVERKEMPEARSEDLLSKYDEAAAHMRELMMLRDQDSINRFVSKWISFLKHGQFPPELVKEWVLKLVLDLRVKLSALQFFRAQQTIESMYEEILEVKFLGELESWLIDNFHSFLSLVNEVYEQTRRKEILDAFKYVAMNLEKKISLEEVSSHLYLNPSYFSRLFKKEVGETFVEYVTKIKINRAKELLEQTTDSVGKICDRLGYDNQSYFIKIFKNYVGVTPIEYRGGKG